MTAQALQIANVGDAAPHPDEHRKAKPRIPGVITLDHWRPQVHNRETGVNVRPSQFRFSRRGGFNHFRVDARQIAAGQHLDAAESQFYVQQLKHMIQQAFAVEYQSLNARSIIPVYFAGDPGAATVDWRQTDEYGEAEIVSDWAQDAPLADASGEEMSQRARSLRVRTQYSIQEIRSAAKAGIPLSENKATSARNALLRKENRLAWDGDVPTGINGFLNDENLRRRPASQAFDAMTGVEMEDEMHAIANAIVDETDVEEPDVLGLPTKQYNKAAVTRFGTDSERTVLQVFLVNSPYIRSVARIRELKGAGAGGTDAMIAFNRSLDKVRVNVMLDLEVFPPEFRGGVTQTTWHSRTAGVTWHKPLSGLVFEGI